MYTEELINSFKEIFSKDNIRIIAHRSPDGDTLGSCFALCKTLKLHGKNAEVVCSDRVSPRLTVLTEGKAELEPTFTPDCTVTVDVATADLLGKKYMDMADTVDYAIDHHYTHKPFAKKVILDGKCSSAGEFLFNLLEQAEIQINKEIAKLLYAAIVTDTGCFKFSNATPETHISAAKLLRYGIETESLTKVLLDEASIEYIRFECDVINNMRIYDGKIVFLPITKEMMERNNIKEGETDGLAFLLRRIQGAEVGATLRETDEKIRISLRSFGNTNVAEIAARFDGGGHVKAAGCGINGDIEFAEKALLEEIRNKINGESL